MKPDASFRFHNNCFRIGLVLNGCFHSVRHGNALLFDSIFLTICDPT